VTKAGRPARRAHSPVRDEGREWYAGRGRADPPHIPIRRKERSMSAPGPSDTRGAAALKLLLVIAVLATAFVVMRSGGTLIGHSSSPPTDHVRWRPIASAEALARESQRPILYDFTADWCPPCQLMKREMFSDAATANNINLEFIPVQVLDRQREDGQNPPEVAALQERFNIGAFPTLVIVAPDGGKPVVLEGYEGRGRMTSAIFEAGNRVSLEMMKVPRLDSIRPAPH
jgi:thiol:disulfide interchange protein